MDWIEINQSLVYILLFGYCALKSGALPLLAGVLAHSGALDVVPVLAASFLGGYIGDEMRFFVARRYGDKLFASRPRWRAYVERAAQVMERYGTAYVFLYRYPKGMRTIGALPLGLSEISWMRFTLLNAASAALWSGVLVGLGFFLGDQLAEAAESWWGTASVVLLAIFLIAGWFAFRTINRRIFAHDLNANRER
ncbi:DedA family protein [Minwuia sp.]|uniref:DedA family protein n=1 Tax=Minwuia sp. TaxID=2493630 RepID=UPI003A900CC2